MGQWAANVVPTTDLSGNQCKVLQVPLAWDNQMPRATPVCFDPQTKTVGPCANISFNVVRSSDGQVANALIGQVRQ